MRGLPLVVVLAALCTAAPARAESEVQQWTELGVKWEATDRLALSFDQLVRFDADVSRLGSFMPEPAAQYRVRKWLRVGVGYRLQYERDGAGDMRARHRFFANSRLRLDLDAVRIEHRLQLQEQLRPDDGNSWRHRVRNRLDVAYRALKPWIPAASVELHHALGDGDTVHLEKIWLTAGVGHAGKRREVELFYRVELPIFDSTEPTLHILGAALHHDL